MTAFQTQFKAELIAGFEQTESLIRKTVTTEGTMKGNSFVFAVGDSGSAEAVTRGTNGLIPARADSIVQYTATLVEWHDLVRRTEFNIFASQGDGRKLMQNTVMGTINRKMDQDILLGLSAATQTTGAAQQASLDLVMYAKVILGNNEVPSDGNISAIISPAFHAELMKTTEFASVDYINDKPFTNMPVMFRWAGVNFIEHPNLSGKGTAAEICYMYHKSAIGHAANSAGVDTAVGYDEEQDYSFARCSMFMGAKLLQNSGIVKITHDGSNYAAQA